ncbi:MAG: cation-transporting P-type ATPase [Candidatus Saccharibacteria bacterium]|nr:cation-transporting P-type ATPase [Candidatus Saccharibacteria bacterium]
MEFYNLSVEQALKHLSSSTTGLTTKQAKHRQKQHGLNLFTIKTQPLWQQILAPFFDIFTLILLLAALISLSQNQFLDASIIFFILSISILIFYLQHFSTQKILKSLQRFTEQTVTVFRNHQIISISSKYLVPGDVINLSAGEKVPADLRIITANHLRVNEAQLTGESLPIDKNSQTLTGHLSLHQQSSLLFQGSFVLSGTATAVVIATGNHTVFGRIAKLSKPTITKSPLQTKIDRLIFQIVILVSIISAVIFIFNLLHGVTLATNLRLIIALAISAIPESLPLTISVILALGVRRLARKKALIRNLRTIETIGATTLIATDKTGTLTKNLLTVQACWSPNTRRLQKIIAHTYSRESSHDPLDLALARFSEDFLHPSLQPVAEIPFDQNFALSAIIWKQDHGYRTYYKGAPESIIKLSKPPKSTLTVINQVLTEFTSHGYRVIALATSQSPHLIPNFTSIKKQDLTFAGLVAVADTLRPEAATAIKTATKAGISIRMITGDHPETAFQIGQQLQLTHSRNQVLNCQDLVHSKVSSLPQVIEQTTVFARVTPEQKYQLLNHFQTHHITAMTGDGVNDVPALTRAHVGIAMGTGSSVAQDASDIILLDDNFKTILTAVKEGRIIVANIRRMFFYLLSTNIGELLVMLGAILLGVDSPLTSIQILWINLITDTTMVIPLGLEPAEKNLMKNPPHHPRDPILAPIIQQRMLIVILTIATLSLGIYFYFLQHHGHHYAQTLTFLTLVVSQWGNAFNARSQKESLFQRLKVKNPSFYFGLTVSIILQLVVIFTPIRNLLGLAFIQVSHFLIIALSSFLLPILVCELHKLFAHKKA